MDAEARPTLPVLRTMDTTSDAFNRKAYRSIYDVENREESP